MHRLRDLERERINKPRHHDLSIISLGALIIPPYYAPHMKRSRDHRTTDRQREGRREGDQGLNSIGY